METALIKVFAFVCIIVAGYCMGHTGKLGNMPGEFVSKIVFTFTLPCAVLHAFGAADFSPQMLLLVPLGFVFAFGAYLVTFAITPRTKREDRTFYLLNGCGFNLGCFALPFVQAIFSPNMSRALSRDKFGQTPCFSGPGLIIWPASLPRWTCLDRRASSQSNIRGFAGRAAAASDRRGSPPRALYVAGVASQFVATAGGVTFGLKSLPAPVPREQRPRE